MTISSTISAQSSVFYDYIEQYKKIAIKEMDRAGVPASIKLAQALLESNAGRSELARKANNHFGMKCGSSWKGKTFHKKDDDYDEFGNLKNPASEVTVNLQTRSSRILNFFEILKRPTFMVFCLG